MEKHELISSLIVYLKDHIATDELIYCTHEGVCTTSLRGKLRTKKEQSLLHYVPHKDPVEKQRGTLFSPSAKPESTQEISDTTQSLYSSLQAQKPTLGPIVLFVTKTTPVYQKLCKAINQKLCACQILDVSTTSKETCHQWLMSSPQIKLVLSSEYVDNLSKEQITLQPEDVYEQSAQEKHALWKQIQKHL